MADSKWRDASSHRDITAASTPSGLETEPVAISSVFHGVQMRIWNQQVVQNRGGADVPECDYRICWEGEREQILVVALNRRKASARQFVEVRLSPVPPSSRRLDIGLGASKHEPPGKFANGIVDELLNLRITADLLVEHEALQAV
jgi:hypothetical protein